MTRAKYRLVHTSCRRCNKPLLTGNRALYLSEALKARLDRICAECITPEEQHELDTAVPVLLMGGAR